MSVFAGKVVVITGAGSASARAGAAAGDEGRTSPVRRECESLEETLNPSGGTEAALRMERVERQAVFATRRRETDFGGPRRSQQRRRHDDRTIEH